MDIGGTSLSSLYSGNSFSGSFPSSQAIGADQTSSIDPINPANAAKNDDQNAASPRDQSAAKSPKTPSANAFRNAKGQADKNLSTLNLSESDVAQIQKLKQRDTEVRNHESAHLAAAGKYATGGASFEYKRGPDGKNYAVGGEVGIDTSPIPDDPQATIQKARQIKSAAQAPANPSATDRQVAASAGQMEVQARQEIAEQRISGEEGEDIGVKNSKEDNELANEASNDNTLKTSHNKIAASKYQTIENMSQQERQTASVFEAFV